MERFKQTYKTKTKTNYTKLCVYCAYSTAHTKRAEHMCCARLGNGLNGATKVLVFYLFIIHV